ncbi:hypothetical protein T484DRAFT_1972369 [Baffinella frigidus]|nr:hypothetical protein T484DRAFT_1972369 [Cryptophyta sp. CCMP2293]|mmetsp:Transcript_60319/g.143359  ORF Transcript_60319/g.143359 Transcript_60319/m.143359 type:complete len:249 (-) Transcript_60319:48-794(-)
MMTGEQAGAPPILFRGAARQGRASQSYGDVMQHMLSLAIASSSRRPSDASAEGSTATPKRRATSVDTSSFAARAASPQHRCPPQLQPLQGSSSSPTPTCTSSNNASSTRASLFAFGSSPSSLRRTSQSSYNASPERAQSCGNASPERAARDGTRTRASCLISDQPETKAVTDRPEPKAVTFDQVVSVLEIPPRPHSAPKVTRLTMVQEVFGWRRASLDHAANPRNQILEEWESGGTRFTEERLKHGDE